MRGKDRLIDADLGVREAARRLGIEPTNSLRERIVRAAVREVERSMEELAIEPTTLDDVHKLILNVTRMQVLRVENDADFERARAELRRAHPGLPGQLEFEFSRKTEAFVVQKSTVGAHATSRYLAVVDARGERRARAWFGERHEPTHLLIKDPGANRTWRRTKVTRREPIELVVDSVASKIGFWDPIVRPVLEASMGRTRYVLDAFEDARRLLAPAASKEASYRAFAALMDRPLIIVFSEYGSRIGDERAGGDPSRSFALRARSVIPNGPAEDLGLSVWRNFRIPTDSVIARAHSNPDLVTFCEEDDLGRWRSESGGRLRPGRVKVVARGRWATIEAAEDVDVGQRRKAAS